MVPGRKEPAMNLVLARPSLPALRLPDVIPPPLPRSMAALLVWRPGPREETGVAGGHYSCGDYLKYLID